MAKNRKHAEPFIKLPLKLLTSRAWHALGPNAKRLIEFLMIEHLRHGGRRNGHLLAPRRQLEEGISEHLVSGAIKEAEALGFVDCTRGVGRCPSVYTLTWLPLSDGSEPSNRYLECDDAAAAVMAARKASKRRISPKKSPVMTLKKISIQTTALCAENDCQMCSHKARSDSSNSSHYGYWQTAVPI
jgi:hypothetical protein